MSDPSLCIRQLEEAFALMRRQEEEARVAEQKRREEERLRQIRQQEVDRITKVTGPDPARTLTLTVNMLRYRYTRYSEIQLRLIQK